MQEPDSKNVHSPLQKTGEGRSAAFSRASAPDAAASQVQGVSEVWGSESVYTRMFGIRPLLSCQGHNTVIGGSRMPAEVLRAMAEAGHYFVDMHELNEAAGRRIAEVMKTEGGLVTAGAFSGLVLGAAACLTGTDAAKIHALPHPAWERRECLVQRHHRFDYDRAYRAAGMTLVEVETKRDLINAIGKRTAMIAALARVERMKHPPAGLMMPREFVEIGKKSGVPVLIDAASELPPPDVLTRYTGMGADLVAISGGKGIRGPQSTGILAGRKELVEAATLNHSPHTAIGRGMKVGKEEIVALIAALNRYVSLDHEAVVQGWNKKTRYLAERLREIPGMRAECNDNTQGFDDVFLEWDAAMIPLTGNTAAEMLRAGEPRILINGSAETRASLTAQCMEDGDEVLAARRLRAFFLQQSKAA